MTSLMGLVAGAVVGRVMPAKAHASEPSAACRVHAVVAEKTGSGVPKELEFLRKTLEDDAFAAYKGFRLLDHQVYNLAISEPIKHSFRSGHDLTLALLGMAGSRLELQAKLVRQNDQKQLLGTKYGIENQGLLMVQAGVYNDKGVSGKLFFAVQCAKKS